MKKNKKGFTLVELVIVVAVMAVLIAVAIPTVTSITRTAKETVANTNAQTIESTLKLAEADKNKNGDLVVYLDAADVEDALKDARLGIAEGSVFVYKFKEGVVTAVLDNKTENDKAATVPTSANEYVIIFGATNDDLQVLEYEESKVPVDPDLVDPDPNAP